jgi:hypothetical protein
MYVLMFSRDFQCGFRLAEYCMAESHGDGAADNRYSLKQRGDDATGELNTSAYISMSPSGKSSKKPNHQP